MKHLREVNPIAENLMATAMTSEGRVEFYWDQGFYPVLYFTRGDMLASYVDSIFENGFERDRRPDIFTWSSFPFSHTCFFNHPFNGQYAVKLTRETFKVFMVDRRPNLVPICSS